MTRNTLLLLSVIAALVGCGGENPATPDGGITPDATTSPDGGPPPDAQTAEAVCDDVRTIALTLGANEITGNTAGRGNDVVLGENCGDPEGARAPQEAIALTIPGTGPVGVSFTLANDGTATTFDTIVELRRDGCGNVAGAELCEQWDDVVPREDVRSGGAFRATGGDTVHLIIGGFATANSGPWQMDVEVESLTAPTQTAVTAERIGGTRFEFDVTGGDANSDAAGILVAFLDAAGAEIGIDPDGDPATPDETEFQFGFDEPVAGMATFTAHSTVGGVDEFPQLLTAAQVRVAVVDAWGLESEPMTVPVTDLMESGRGEPCTAGYVCADAFECVADVCAIPAATATFCAAAAPIALVPAGTTATTTTVTGSVPAMAGSIGDGEVCDSDTEGAEVLYQLTVPVAVAPVTAYDVVLDTENATTGEGDTIVYLQSTCGDPETTGACNDDIDLEGMNYASHLETNAVAAGTHTVVVEGYGVLEAALAFELEVSLRPVLATGTACDPAGVMNRCGAGACPAATMLCP